MKCRYCGGDVACKTIVTAEDKMVLLVDCPKCGKYIDYNAPLVCNKCGSILKSGICKKCAVRWFAKNGLKSEEVKIATAEDVTRTFAEAVAASITKDDDTLKEKLKEIARIVPQVFEDD